MEDKKNIQDELNEAASQLSRIPKENPFSVPENYFERLPMEVQQRIAGQEKQKAWAGSFMPRWVPALALVVIMLAAGIFVMLQRHNTVAPVQVAIETPASTAPVEIYSVEDMLSEDVDEDALVDALAKAETPVKQPNVARQDSLEQYVIDNYEDAQLIDEL